MVEKKRIDSPTGTETVGHEWDGIEELDTPMPRWWLWTLYATIIWGIGYTIVYPAWPMIDRATDGLWGWSSRGQLAAEIAADDEAKRPVMLALSQIPIERLEQDSRLMGIAREGGAAAFRVNCVQCHGAGAAGSPGYPNLNDDDWLWGGDMKAIHQSIEYGIRDDGHPDSRQGLMPAFGRDGILSNGQIAAVTSHVLSLSGQGKASAAGAQLYADNCAICHGADGKGDRTFGAPNLADPIWLYGGDRAAVTASIRNGRAGAMPAWGERLDPATIKMLAAYVHSLGGGEDFVPEREGAQTDEAAGVTGQPPVAVVQNARP